MPPKINLAGQRFGKLTVVQEIGKKYNRPLWECVCDCGSIVVLPSMCIKKRRRPSCTSCYDQTRRTHGCTNSREYRSWNGARSRCRVPSNKAYHHYGGRGIIFSTDWDDFTVFLRDMGPCPVGHTLDRIDVNGNYELGNCRWATPKQQQNNLRNNRILVHEGESLTAAQWCERLGVPNSTLHSALSNGYTISDIVYRKKAGLEHRKLQGKFPLEVCKEIKEAYLSIPTVNNGRPKGSLAAICNKYGISSTYVFKIANTNY